MSILESSESLNNITNIANDQLLSYLEKIPGPFLTNYGITSKSDFVNVSLGEPYQLFYLDNEDIGQINQKQINVKEIIHETNMWYFPVIFDSKYIAILIIDKMNDHWKAVSFGYSSLSKELFEIEEVWKSNDDYNIVLITNFQLQKYFFSIIMDNTSDNLTEIVFPGNSSEFNVDYSKLENIINTIDVIKNVETGTLQ